MNPKIQLDPRIEPMFRTATPRDKFIAQALCTLLATAPSASASAVKGRSALEDLIDATATKDIDWTEIVAGKPLSWWNGKSYKQISRELPPEKIALVQAAYRARGLKGDHLNPPPPSSPPPSPATSKQSKAPAPPTVASPAQARQPGPEGGEPTFAGRKLSELAPLGDADLLKIEGISKATIKKIRELSAPAAVPPASPAPPPSGQ